MYRLALWKTGFFPEHAIESDFTSAELVLPRAMRFEVEDHPSLSARRSPVQLGAC